MKRSLGKIVSVLSATFLLLTLTGCVSLLPDFSEKQIVKFQGAQGTPKDSVVFYGFLPMNDIVKFKHIFLLPCRFMGTFYKKDNHVKKSS